jgi:chromosome segregation ATPase
MPQSAHRHMQDALQSKVALLTGQLAAADAQLATNASTISSLENELNSNAAAIAEAHGQLQAAQGRCQVAEAAQRQLQSEHAAAREQLASTSEALDLAQQVSLMYAWIAQQQNEGLE